MGRGEEYRKIFAGKEPTWCVNRIADANEILYDECRIK